MKNRFLAMLLTLCMVLTMMSTAVFAEGLPPLASSAVCTHHVHDDKCGYAEGTPCTHVHDSECYTTVTRCIHKHTDECYPASDEEATDSEAKEPINCTHTCDAESGCIKEKLSCKHIHDETCGYMKGTPCTFDPTACEICHPKGSSAVVPETEPILTQSVTPTTDTATVVKETFTQAAVSFALNNEPSYADTAIWSVYANHTTATSLTDITVGYAANTLTLTHETDIPAATYYVSVTEDGKTESARLALTVEEVASPTMLNALGLPEEQFQLEVGDTYYFDLSAEEGNIGSLPPGFPDLHYVPFVYTGTINAYSLDADSSGNANASTAATTSPRSLFLAEYNVGQNSSWNNLNIKKLIFGKTYDTNYTLRSLSGGCNSPNYGGIKDPGTSGMPVSNEWDQIYQKDHGYIKNFNEKYSWTQDTVLLGSGNENRALRGGDSATCWIYKKRTTNGNSIGWRPALEVKNPEVLGDDGLKPVELDLNGGSFNESISISIICAGDSFTAPSGEVLTAPEADPEAEAPLFIHWMDDSGNAYLPGASVPNTVTKLTAQWGMSELIYAVSHGGKADIINTSEPADFALQLTNGGTYVISMAPDIDSTAQRIIVDAGADQIVNITLTDIFISSACAFEIKSGIVNLTLAGENILESTEDYAGLQQNKDAGLLTIDGTGSLDATGQKLGIGGGQTVSMGSEPSASYDGVAAHIVINGGTITANGIGGSNGKITASGTQAGGAADITINDGTVTSNRAIGFDIGGGAEVSQVQTIGDSDHYGAANITINGGTVVCSNYPSNGVTDENQVKCQIGGGYYRKRQNLPAAYYDSTILVTGGTVTGNCFNGPKLSNGKIVGDFIISTKSVEGYHYDKVNRVLTITDSGAYTISMKSGVTTTSQRIAITAAGEVNLTLDGVKITASTGNNALTIGNGSTVITLAANSVNSLTGGDGTYNQDSSGGTGGIGLQCGSGILNIRGDGTLRVTGGNGGFGGQGSNAGNGGDGIFTIGTVTAQLNTVTTKGGTGGTGGVGSTAGGGTSGNGGVGGTGGSGGRGIFCSNLNEAIKLLTASGGNGGNGGKGGNSASGNIGTDGIPGLSYSGNDGGAGGAGGAGGVGASNSTENKNVNDRTWSIAHPYYALMPSNTTFQLTNTLYSTIATFTAIGTLDGRGNASAIFGDADFVNSVHAATTAFRESSRSSTSALLASLFAHFGNYRSLAFTHFGDYYSPAPTTAFSDMLVMAVIDTKEQIVNSATATFTPEAVQVLAGNNVGGMTVLSTVGSMSLSNKALQQLLMQTNGSFTMRMGSVTSTPLVKKSDQLPNSTAELLIDHNSAVDYSITDANGNAITDLGGATMQIGIPYTPKQGEDTGRLIGVYLAENGEATPLANSIYSAKNQMLYSRTLHNSTYAVGYKTDIPKFNDIDSHWAKKDIEFVSARELIRGTGENVFSPDAPITVGDFITALSSIAGKDMSSLIVGDKKQAMTRQEMAEIILQFTMTTNYKITDNRGEINFIDSTNEAVKIMQIAGVIMGKDGNRFDPTGTATRGEASAVLRRYIELLIDRSTTQGLDMNDSGKFVYYENGKLFTGAKIIDGMTYNFGSDGTCTTTNAIDVQ